MSGSYIRIWEKVNISDVQKHLLLIDDLYGSCANCKQIGLNFLKDPVCPNCNVKFKYLATRLKSPAELNKILNRIEKEGLSFTLVDRDDFDRCVAGDTFGGLFSKTEKDIEPEPEAGPDPETTA